MIFPILDELKQGNLYRMFRQCYTACFAQVFNHI